MYELTVRTVFSASHALLVAGVREPEHSHDWRVVVSVEGDQLDEDGLLCDFHALEAALGDVVAPFHGRLLNETPPLDRSNPTAELVAACIASQFEAAIASLGSAPLRVSRVCVTEAPGCEASFMPPISVEQYTR